MTVLAGAAAYPLLAGAQQNATPVVGEPSPAWVANLHRSFRQLVTGPVLRATATSPPRIPANQGLDTRLRMQPGFRILKDT